MKKMHVKYYIYLHLALLLYSVGALMSKKAAQYTVFSKEFILCYACVVGVCAVYAVVWQQILKKMTLFTAYANKAITVVWGVAWGRLFFGEKITFFNILGTIIIILGICMVARGEESDEKNR